MSKTRTILLSTITACLLMLGISPVQATLLNFTLTGQIDFADSPNDFGLVDLDTIFATGTYDDSTLSGSGTESIIFDGVTNFLNVDLNLKSFTQADDDRFGTGFPKLIFVGGAFSALDFSTSFDTNGFFDSFPASGVTDFEGEDDNFNIIEGVWTGFETSPVPVPATVWLFGSGLLGLVGVARRKRTS